MRPTLRRAAVFLLLTALPAAGAFAETTHSQRIDEATALSDAGKFDEAIAKLQGMLKEDPADVTARYELALTYAAKGDTKQCRAIAEPVANEAGPLQVTALTLIANCLDNEHDSKGAIATYRKALAINSEDAEVALNLGIARATQGSVSEALSYFKQHATKDPGHASGQYALAKMFEAQTFTVPALFSYLHFLALEPSGPRAEDAAARVRALMDAGFQKKTKGANISIDPNASKAEDDYTAMALMLPMAAASRDLEEKAKLSQFEQIRLQLVDDVKMFAEMVGKQTDFTATTHGPFFQSMIDARALDGFAAVALLSQHLPGMQEWAKAHSADVETFLAWRRPLATKGGLPAPPAP